MYTEFKTIPHAQLTFVDLSEIICPESQPSNTVTLVILKRKQVYVILIYFRV